MTVHDRIVPAPGPARGRAGRIALAVATGFMSFQAVYGAVLLVQGGEGLPDPPSILPGDGWWPGAVALLVVVGVPIAAACVLQVRRDPRADTASIAAGLILVGWIVVQVALIGLTWFLQPLCFVIGLLIALGAWWHDRVVSRVVVRR